VCRSTAGKGRWDSNTLLWTVRRYGHPPRAWANESRYCHSRARNYVACAPTRPARGSGTNAGATILCKGVRRKRVLWEVRCLESVSRPCRDPLLGPTKRRRGKRPCPLMNIRLLRYAIRAHGSSESGERSAFELVRQLRDITKMLMRKRSVTVRPNRP
jgi:hypothetical protein